MKLQLLFLVLSLKLATQEPKCCAPNQNLIKNDSNYVCVADKDKRLQIFTEPLNLSSTGDCFEVFEGSVTRFFQEKEIFTEKGKLDVNFYPKCCPLNNFYNTVRHACVFADNMTNDFVKQKFVKVGLPDCRIIQDYKLRSGGGGALDYRYETGNLYLRNSVSFAEGKFCLDYDEKFELLARGCHGNLSICRGVRCFRKCCPDGQSFVQRKICKNTYNHGLDLSFSKKINYSEDPFAIIHGITCGRIYLLEQEKVFFLDADGTFNTYVNKSLSFEKFQDDEEQSYCIEHLERGKNKSFEFFMCYPKRAAEPKFIYTLWAKILSIIFIVVTICVYFFLPDMLNLFGKILVNYCFTILAAFGIIIYIQNSPNVGDASCFLLGLLSSFLSLCSFTWLNVMCFDIWWTFGSPKSLLTIQQKKRELKKLLMYSSYAWGIPAFITLLVFLAYKAGNDVPYSIKPFLGNYKCYWERRQRNYGMLLYYVLPLILTELTNVILFVKTLRYCLKVKKEICRMNDNRMSLKERHKTFNSDKEQLLLVLKLAVIMGISFVFEVVSSLFDFKVYSVSKYIEAVWDTITCLQGVFIFVIFVCKQKVWRLCKNRICTERFRKASATSLTTQQVSVPLTSCTSKIRNV